MALRNTLIAQILKAIEQSSFTVADFELKHPKPSDNYLLHISFRHNPEFFLTVKEGESQFYTVESPGAHKKQERESFYSLSSVPERVTAWTKCVRDELRTALPVYAELDELRNRLDKHITENVEKPNLRFTDAEADELRSKLDDLAERFKEMQEANAITEQELKKLSEELDSIKVNLTTYPKGTWYKTAANKLWAVTNKIVTSKESREVLAKAAQKMLGMGD